MVRNRFTIGTLAAVFLAVWVPASAHPVPFSYIDLRLQPDALELTLVVHIFDLAHDLSIEPPERLFEPATLAARGDDVVALLRKRLTITVDGGVWSAGTWSAPEPLPDRQSMRLRARVALTRPPGRVDLSAAMFPYDPQHKTFLNVYEGGCRHGAGDSRQRPDPVRVFRGYAAGRLGGAAEIRALGGPSHPDRARSPAVSGRPAASRRLDSAVAAGRDRVYYCAQHHAVAGGAEHGHSAGGRRSSRPSRSASSTSARTTCSSAAAATCARGLPSRSV